MRRWRIALGAGGVTLSLFGAFRLLTQVPITSDLLLIVWMAATVVIHDGVLAPLVIGIGRLLRRAPPRARRWLQAALVTGALVTTIALPLIARRGSQPAAKAILRRDYAGNLIRILCTIGVITLVLYALQVVRDAEHARHRPRAGVPR